MQSNFAHMEFSNFDNEVLEKSSALFRAVTHKLRLSIIRLLDDKSEINVNEIYTTLKLEQSITSQHLKVLRDTQVVNTRREGKMIFYTLNYETLAKVEETAAQIEKLIRVKPKTRRQIAESEA